MTNSTKIPNRLINEKSPYLLQHAYNPVDWFPWGEEAFEKARLEDKPVFLSIGYSTCHWCHVMAHESFEDQQVAEILNQSFVSVKVDREERPDIDTVYMQVCQALNGNGGWPLTILMTPDKQPFYAATYLPKQQKYGYVGLMELLTAIADQWQFDKKEKLVKSAGDIAKAVANAQTKADKKSLALSKEPLEKAYQRLKASFDPAYGGFGSAPKFPMSHNLMFLLRYYLLEQEPKALEMTEKTLQQMLKGGIFDHIGYGFSRYSTDNRWLAPHFEKMLYDNALLIIALLECYQVTGNQLYREYAEKTLSYINREMAAPQGGFYSAQDADSEGVEGKYYVFTPAEIIKILGQEEGAWFNSQFEITPKGNFEGKSIPNLINNPNWLKLKAQAAPMLAKLYEFRLTRTYLHKDDKILTSWNALMIIAYTRAYRVFGDKQYLQTAQKALELFVRQLEDEGRLKTSWREGKSSGAGLLDDYAFLAWAFLELYEATFELDYFKKALELSQLAFDLFYDPQGGFYLSPEDGEALLFRPKETYDGAVPSGNSVLGYALIRLAALTGEEKWLKAAEGQSQFLLSQMGNYPLGHTFALMALMGQVYPSKKLVCVVKDKDQIRPLKEMLDQKIRPELTVLLKTPETSQALAQIAPFTRDYAIPPDKAAAFYLCQNQSCQTPVFELEDLAELL